MEWLIEATCKMGWLIEATCKMGWLIEATFKMGWLIEHFDKKTQSILHDNHSKVLQTFLDPPSMAR